MPLVLVARDIFNLADHLMRWNVSGHGDILHKKFVYTGKHPADSVADLSCLCLLGHCSVAGNLTLSFLMSQGKPGLGNP